VHGIVPGGGLAPDADRWVPCKPGFFLSVRVLSRLFRRRFLEELQNAHRDGQLKFFGEHVDLADPMAFADWLIACDERGVTFRWKDYRAHGSTRYKTMTLRTDEFMRRFLLHVLPSGFHRIRHYGLLANANRTTQIATARELLHQPAPKVTAERADAHAGCGCLRPTFVCRHCGAPMLVIETFARAQYIRGPPSPPRPP
jgi:hypothetical protein